MRYKTEIPHQEPGAQPSGRGWVPAPPGQQVPGLQIWPLKVAELRLNVQSGETTHPFPRGGEGVSGERTPWSCLTET